MGINAASRAARLVSCSSASPKAPGRSGGCSPSTKPKGLRHNYIGTEHLLLGLLYEEEGVAARVLESLDITLEEGCARRSRESSVRATR